MPSEDLNYLLATGEMDRLIDQMATKIAEVLAEKLAEHLKAVRG